MAKIPDMLGDYTELLLSAAVRRCDRLEDAQDLVGDTLLAAMTYLARGGVIDDMRAWLFAVMKRRHCDMLRRRYRAAVISIGEGFDYADTEEIDEALLREETCISVRRQVAYLAQQYREILVRHYFRGERIADIAVSLGIPEGTVKSRLDYGRKQMKKGMEQMEPYTEHSFLPKHLRICNSGSCGKNMEPMTTVEDDVLGQNLLLLAYEKPMTVPELARAIGVAAAYVEPAVKKLVREELMRESGGRVYTDFIIYREEEQWKYNPDKEAFCRDNAQAFLVPISKAAERLRQTDFYSERLERFMLIDVAAAGVWSAGEPHRKPQVFPERPNGGRWIAFGTVYEGDSVKKEIPPSHRTRENYGMGGIRRCELAAYAGGSNLVMFNYDTSLNPGGYGKLYSLGGHTFMDNEEAFLQLAYLIEKGIDPSAAGYPPKLLEGIAGLCEEGFFTKTEQGPALAVPRLTHAQAKVFFEEICRPAAREMKEALTAPMGQYLASHRTRIPAHLDSVPEQKLTMPHEPPAMAFVYEAIRCGIHRRDLGVCPETLLIFD